MDGAGQYAVARRAPGPLSADAVGNAWEAAILNTLVWALVTSGITGAAWMGIVLMGRQRRLTAEHKELLEDRQRTLDELELLSHRVVELQDRLDFVERHQAALGRPSPPTESSS